MNTTNRTGSVSDPLGVDGSVDDHSPVTAYLARQEDRQQAEEIAWRALANALNANPIVTVWDASDHITVWVSTGEDDDARAALDAAAEAANEAAQEFFDSLPDVAKVDPDLIARQTADMSWIADETAATATYAGNLLREIAPAGYAWLTIRRHDEQVTTCRITTTTTAHYGVGQVTEIFSFPLPEDYGWESPDAREVGEDLATLMDVAHDESRSAWRSYVGPHVVDDVLPITH